MYYPPSLVLGVGLATPPHKTLHATETSMNLIYQQLILFLEKKALQLEEVLWHSVTKAGRKYVTSQRPFLSSRKTTRTGACNVRTMYKLSR